MPDFAEMLAIGVPVETPEMRLSADMDKLAAVLDAVDRPGMRPMTEADIPSVVEIENKSFTKEAYPEQVFRDWLAHGLTGTVVERNEKVAAYLLDRDDDKLPGFRLGQSLAVHPDHRREGLGETLMRDMMAKHAKVSAQVDTTNKASRGMLKKLGFRTVRTYKDETRRAHLMKYETPEKEAAELTLAELKAQSGKTDTDPSDAQKESGNYKKGRVKWKGLILAIENPQGTIRKGKGWQTLMKDHYGYVVGTESKADGDAVDFFLCEDNLDSEIVFIVNQRKKTGGFDEHKAVLGCVSKEQAEKTYLRNYSKGWEGMGEVTPITLDHFKWWMEYADTSKEVKNGFFAAKENLKQEKKAEDPASGETLEAPLNVVIDRPKGFKKTFVTKAGPKELEYPLDYGYFPGTINPEDNEDADVFMGTGGPHHGRFMKGKPGPDGAMVPDERKWYAGLHPNEYEALKNWWETQHDAGLTWDWTDLGDRQKLLADAGVVKQAEDHPDDEEELKTILAEKRYLGRYKCPHCGGTNLYNGIPGTGTTFRGSGVCADCKESCSIVGSKLKRLGDGPEIVMQDDQIESWRKRKRWDREHGYKSEKKANSGIENPVRHVLISGHSGAGKSTLSDKLHGETGYPVVSLDKHPLWAAWKAQDDALDPAEANRLRRENNQKIVADVLANTKEPSIIEGTQLLHADPELVRPHRRILLDPKFDDLVSQRLGRDRTKPKFSPEGMGLPEDEWAEKRRAMAREIAYIYRPYVPRWRSDPGVEVMGRTKEGAFYPVPADQLDEPVLFLVKRGADEHDHPFTIAIDLDGTLAEQEVPFDVDSIGEPRTKAVRWARRFHRSGARIIIFTVRGDTELVKDWLDEHDVPYDFVNENPDQPEGSSGKIFADIYYDDRAFNAVDPDEHGPEILRRVKAHGADTEVEDAAPVSGSLLLESLGDTDDQEEDDDSTGEDR